MQALSFFSCSSRPIRPIVILFFLGLPLLGWATHNRAGEISIEQVGNCVNSLTVRATIVTYTKASSTQADRDSLTLVWGDGTSTRVVRANGPGNPPQGDILENDIKRNVYIATHTYPARGTYIISMTDPNRNGGILNVNFPNSEQVKFHIRTVFTFPNPQFQGCNNTPVLLQPPVDIGCVGQPFQHNPNAYDVDGDSLSYHFTIPLQDVGLEVPNYQFPDMISPGPDNQLSINEVTGDILWDAPQRAGEYNISIIIVEYRDGIPIDTLTRDMQILVEDCQNLPPVVETPFDEICVVAGEEIAFNVRATAPIEEVGQKVRLTALGGPFEVDFSPATFVPETLEFQDDPVVKRFNWLTTCEHIFDQFYSVVFRAVDDFLGPTSGLATLKTVRIKVVGPPPKEVDAVAEEDMVTVSWAAPYECEDAANEYFQGFTVWRRENSNSFPIDTCLPGLAGRGYQQISPGLVQELEDGRYVFDDPNVESGRTYCYRILAVFALTTPGGMFTYNRVESLPSAEACIQLGRDVPIVTNVDVEQTDPAGGAIQVSWSKPIAEDLDTIRNPGPYLYEILRAPGQTTIPDDFQPTGISFESPTFQGANDTTFLDTGLNTQDQSYSYVINFLTSGRPEPLGATNPASSVFLNAAPTDEAVVLSWTETVPWDNFSYRVLRENDTGGFDTLTVTEDPSYRDEGLVNGQEYCYRIEAVGSYGIEGIKDPLSNRSQIVCTVPIDDVPPCPPELFVDNICSENITCTDASQLVNTLTWDNPADRCEDSDDVAGYNVYFAPFEGAEFRLIASIDDPRTTTYDHQPEFGLAGCYHVTAFDNLNNESEFSNEFCVDNCPNYELPNAFTPNGDNQNDLFTPFPFCFIESVEFKVYNRWGQLVFETEDPNLNWDGTNLQGEDLAQGTYFYQCRVFEQRVTGIEQQPELLRGYIELIRGGQ